MSGVFNLTILGARGSIPVSGRQYDIYGGASSCFLIETDEYAIFLDAGTGIINSHKILKEKEIFILLTHTHLDHIMGLPFFRELVDPGRKITIYGQHKNGIGIREQMDGAFAKPYWPLLIEEYPADVSYEKWEDKLTLKCKDGAELVIDSHEIRHPGGALAFRVSMKDRKIVLLTDYEHGETEDTGSFADIDVIEFSKGADLILYDAQFIPSEYPFKKSFGHSTYVEGIKLMEASGSKSLRLIHHDPHHTDEFLSHLEKEIGREDVRLARQGEELEI